MNVITVRVQDRVAEAVEFLTREKRKTKADIIRELMGRAVEEEQLKVYLQKYQNKELSLRKLAEKLDLPYWKAYELVSSKTEFPYSKTDLQRDLKLLEEA